MGTLLRSMAHPDGVAFPGGGGTAAAPAICRCLLTAGAFPWGVAEDSGDGSGSPAGIGCEYAGESFFWPRPRP